MKKHEERYRHVETDERKGSVQNDETLSTHTLSERRNSLVRIAIEKGNFSRAHILQMQKTIRKYDIVSLSNQDKVSNAHGVRIAAQELKLALMACGSYVASEFKGSLLKGSLDVDKAKLSFGSEFSAVIAEGNKGALVRLARVSKCGGFALYGDSIIALGNHGGLKLTAVDCQSLLVSLLKGERGGEAFSIRTSDTKLIIHGIGFGKGKAWKSDLYASLAYIGDNGALVFRDIETRRNAHNDDSIVVSFANGTETEKRDEMHASLAEFAKGGKSAVVAGKATRKAAKAVKASK